MTDSSSGSYDPIVRRPSACLGALLLLAACSGDASTVGPLLAPPEQGYQLNFGPFSVPSASNDVQGDPNVVAGEVQLCRTMKLPNDEPVAVDRLQVALNQGSHHFILFRSTKDFPDQIFPCWGTVNFDDWEFVIDINEAGGNGDGWQLADGQAFIMQPHQQVMLQSHFVNASVVKAPLGGMVTANLYTEDMSKVQHELHGVFTVNTDIHIPPQSTYTTAARICTFSHTAYLVAMTGHFHQRGTKFDVHRVTKRETSPGQIQTFDSGQIYESDSWDSPPFKLFDPPQLTGGGIGGVGFQCSYYNPGTTEVTWGSHADTQEHCNLFFQYYNANPKDELLHCIEGSGGW